MPRRSSVASLAEKRLCPASARRPAAGHSRPAPSTDAGGSGSRQKTAGATESSGLMPQPARRRAADSPANLGRGARSKLTSCTAT